MHKIDLKLIYLLVTFILKVTIFKKIFKAISQTQLKVFQ